MKPNQVTTSKIEQFQRSRQWKSLIDKTLFFSDWKPTYLKTVQDVLSGNVRQMEILLLSNVIPESEFGIHHLPSNFFSPNTCMSCHGHPRYIWRLVWAVTSHGKDWTSITLIDQEMTLAWLNLPSKATLWKEVDHMIHLFLHPHDLLTCISILLPYNSFTYVT